MSRDVGIYIYIYMQQRYIGTLYREYIGFRDISPVIENKAEKTIDHEIESWDVWWFIEIRIV